MKRTLFALGILAAGAGLAWASGQQPIVLVETEIQDDGFSPISSEVVTNVLAPRVLSTGLRIAILDNDDAELDSYRRPDPRRSLVEPELTDRPDGTRVLFSSRVLSGMRWLRARTPGGAIVLDYDLGPALVEGCEDQVIPVELCATFDSDGDGCRDLDDPQPLVPETEPPILSGSITPEILWPPDHRLHEVTAEVNVTDNCDPSPAVVLESVSSSDPESGVTLADSEASGKAPDIAGADLEAFDTEVLLRAERWPSAAGSRTYTLTYRATDRAGNMARLELHVVVPADRRSK